MGTIRPPRWQGLRSSVYAMALSPVADEKKNLLRYAAAFEEVGARTLIRIAQRVELRRDQARELHLLAGLLGERRLSSEMQGHVTEMMRAFLQSARVKLEQQSAPAT